MRIALLGDTHFPRRGSRLPDTCLSLCAAADLIVHTGDLADMACLAHLTAIGPPVVAINGNADDASVTAATPATAEVELPGRRRLGLVHNGGPEKGRLERLRARFAGCSAVAFGHSHIPLLAVADDGFMIINPGSATDRRRQPQHSMVVMDVVGDGPLAVRFVNLDDAGADLPAELIRNVQ